MTTKTLNAVSGTWTNTYSRGASATTAPQSYSAISTASISVPITFAPAYTTMLNSIASTASTNIDTCEL